jgi:hypothetical protein
MEVMLQKESSLVGQKIPTILLKKLPRTEFANQLLVVGQKISYLYSDDNKHLRMIKIEDYLMELLTLFGALSREQIVKYTNLPRTSIYDVLARLMKQNKITIEHIHDGKSQGRPITIFKIS